MLHSRPSSADAFQNNNSQYPTSPRLGQAPRSMYNGQNVYRGPSAAPVQPYAFQSTPHLRQEARTTSAPSISQAAIAGFRQGHNQSTSTSTASSSDTSSAKDDSVIGSRPGSLINLSSQIPDLSLNTFGQDPPVKASPDRYRRPAQKRVDSNSVTQKPSSPQIGISAAPSGSSMSTTGHVYQQQQPVSRQSSQDDVAAKSNTLESAKRYRRRSLNQLETQNLQEPMAGQAGPGAQRPASGHGPSATSTPTTIRPVSFHQRTGSRDGQYAQRNNSNSSLTTTDPNNVSVRSQENTKPVASPSPRVDQRSVPPRGSSDANKRLANPSPLSRSAVESEAASTSPQKPKTYAAAAQGAVTTITPSPAAQHLAAVSDKDLNKGMKSKLRRAFSFGSAQELRRTSAENNLSAASHARATQHRQHVDEEMDAEQQEIARRQEAAGIGAGIYSGQGGFTGSTDNISISSTASSASMMLRKMGKGAKKGARSIKGLFRPKSVIGVPAADGPVSMRSDSIVQPSVAQVSMVTVEAERQKVNVNAHVADQQAGGTGFPKLERNSIDAANAAALPDARGSADGSEVSRRSHVGSDKERAEVLAAVKKGILKRSGTGSPAGSPVIRPTDAGHTPLPQLSDSPASSMPSTPKDGPQGRTASLNGHGDYFSPRMAALVNTKSVPNTPNGSVRGITFSPRIQFHDAWSSQEYDRRGEIATCNRLTPMLAQQIKEELNTFKMVSLLAFTDRHRPKC